MHQHNTLVSLRNGMTVLMRACAFLGMYLRQIGFFEPMERRVHLFQKVLKYTAVQKLEMLFVGLLAGIKAVSHTATMVQVDVALTAACGLPGCADLSVIAQTLNAATEADVADLEEAIVELFGCSSQTRLHAFDQELLVLEWIYLPYQPAERQRVRNEAIWAAVAQRQGASWYAGSPSGIRPRGQDSRSLWLLNRRSLCEHSLKQHQ